MTKVVWAAGAPPVPGAPPVAGEPPVPGDPPLPGEPPVPGDPPLPGEPPVPGVTLATQPLLAQCWVVVQAAPQLPQFTSLVVVSTQLVPHSVCGLVQLVVQLLLLQTWPAWQIVEQLPQCVASDATQEPLQSINPDWH